MGWVYYKHAEVDRRQPRALAVCDRCGLVYNHHRLQFQYDWMGVRMAKLGILVCPSCLDDPQEQRRQFIIPRDPIPIPQPRPEPAIAEMGQMPLLAFETEAFQQFAFQEAPVTPTPYTNFPPDVVVPAPSAPSEPDVIDTTAFLATVTSPSSYFSINQDLGVN